MANQLPLPAPVSLPESEPLPAAVAWQYGWGCLLVVGIAALCRLLPPSTGYLVSAQVFLIAIVIVGTRWKYRAVLVFAALSSLAWNLFLIPPQVGLHLQHPQDILMFFLFFVVAFGMGHLTMRLREREFALARHHQEREQLLAEKHRAELLAESERLHRTLLDSASHELKTPIAIIRTALDGLGQSNPFAREIDTATLRLQRIVENFLEMTRVESDAVKPQADWCELEDVIHAATMPLQRELEGHDLHIHEPPDMPLLKLDSGLLAQALRNVLHNATISAPEPSDIEITAKLETTDGQTRLVLAVRDHGLGFVPGSAERAFDKFYRAPGSPGGGTGLGLAIVRGLLRAMQGDAEATNHPDGGAIITLWLRVETHAVTAPTLL